MSPLSIGLCVTAFATAAAVLVWRHVRLSRAANRPEVIAAASWWTRTISGMARGEGYKLHESAARAFAAIVRRHLGKSFLKDGYYPTLSTQRGKISREFGKAMHAAGLSRRWIPADVAMFVFADCVTVKCGTEKEDPLQIVWSPA